MFFKILPELGHLLLIFAFLFSICQTSIGLWAFFKKDNILMYWVPAWVYAEVSFLFLSYFFLTYAFFINDFSLAYVAGHSHSFLPIHTANKTIHKKIEPSCAPHTAEIR